jgi:hypothetical protein
MSDPRGLGRFEKCWIGKFTIMVYVCTYCLLTDYDLIHDLPSESPNRFFTQIWPHLKRSAGEIVKHKFRRNNSTGKSTDNVVFTKTNFHAFTIPFRGAERPLLSALIQIILLRRDKDFFQSVIRKFLHLMSVYPSIWIFSRLRISTMIMTPLG